MKSSGSTGVTGTGGQAMSDEWLVTCDSCDYEKGPFENHWEAIQKSVDHRTDPKLTNHDTDISKTNE